MKAMLKELLVRVCLAAALLCVAAGAQAADRGKEPVRVIKLAVADGDIVGPDVKTDRRIGWILVSLGETIEMRLSTDEHVSLHLHGYNVAVRLAKGERSRIRIMARQPGRFPLAIKTLVSEVEMDAKEGKADHPSEDRMLFYVDVRPRQTALQ